MAKPNANQASRLPSTRESRPALIGLAVLLIVGGALASAFLAIQSGNRAYFVQIDQEVAQGATIQASDLGKVSLPEDFKNAIPAGDTKGIVGKPAETRLLPGTVLIRSMVASKEGIAAGQTRLTIAVDSSPFIRGLQSGDQLALAVGSSNGDSRQAVYAELVSVGSEKSGGITASGGDKVSMVVAIDLSCLSVVSQGVDDSAVTPALIGSTDGGVVAKTCRS